MHISYYHRKVKLSRIFYLHFSSENGILLRIGSPIGNYTLEVGLVNTLWTVLLVILIIAVIALVVFYFLGRKLEKRQVESQALMEAAAQTVSMLIIDKKKLKLKEAGLPKMVYEQTPKYLRRSKVPVVKAKIGPKVMTLMADPKVFEALPVKSEVKVVLSGIYITEIKSVRGGSIVTPPKKKGFFARFKKDKDEKK